MPFETRLFVKAGLIWLLATFALGAYMLAAKALGMAILPGGAVVHSHMGFVGWLVNLVIGIALWFLPVNRARFENNGRYPIAWVRVVFVLLNGGLLLRILAEPLFDTSSYRPLTAAALLISAVMQLLAIITFIVIAWSRVRDVNPVRET